MRKQPYPVAQLTGGLDISVDATFLVDINSPNLRNVWFDKGLVKKGLGWTQFGATALDGTPMFMDSFPMSGGTIHLLFATPYWVYRWKSTDNTFEKKNPAVPFTGDEDDQFSGVVTLDNAGVDTYILTNGKDKIQHWHGDLNNFTELGGWSTSPILAKRLAIFQSRLIAGFTIESGTICPWRVRWSVVGNPENVTGTGSGFVDLAETADWVVALAALKNKLYVFKERSIWELVYVGGTDVFKPTLKVEGIGTYSPHSVVNLGQELIFYGSDNIYIYDGIDLVPIGKNIYPYLYETESKIVNSTKVNRVPGVYIEELLSYQLCFPTQGDTPALLAEYNFDAKAWTFRDRQVTAFGFYSVPGQPRWIDLVGTWNDQTWVWMDKPLVSGAPTTLMGTPDGTIYEDNRLTKSTDVAYFETKDFIFSRAQRWIEVRVLAKGGPFTLSYSLDRGISWSSPKTLAQSSEFTEYIVPLNATSQQIRFKLQTTAEELEVKWIEPYYIPRQRSKSLTYPS